MRGDFDALVAKMDHRSRASAESAAAWLSTLSVADVLGGVQSVLEIEGRHALARRVTPNPPTVIDVFHLQGFVLQLLYWYPLVDRSVYGNYDTEDVHSHFGFIATRALVGSPYLMEVFEVEPGPAVLKKSELLFEEGMSRVVVPEEVHSVHAAGPRPAVSLRVVFPPVLGRMQIYDRASGRLKEEIVCGVERRSVELAGMLATLSDGALAEEVDALRESCLLPSSKAELDRLVAFAKPTM